MKLGHFEGLGVALNEVVDLDFWLCRGPGLAPEEPRSQCGAYVNKDSRFHNGEDVGLLRSIEKGKSLQIIK